MPSSRHASDWDPYLYSRLFAEDEEDAAVRSRSATRASRGGISGALDRAAGHMSMPRHAVHLRMTIKVASKEAVLLAAGCHTQGTGSCTGCQAVKLVHTLQGAASRSAVVQSLLATGSPRGTIASTAPRLWRTWPHILRYRHIQQLHAARSTCPAMAQCLYMSQRGRSTAH
jgi:hypothetical protein